ncbi:hypothetical protein H0H92_003634 [Tricholoma furcatifolium]|nr:hypothetical protein H0H92_003634 [Tricholoma furcatifolium]
MLPEPNPLHQPSQAERSPAEVQTQHNAPSDNATSIYTRSFPSIPPIAKARRYKPRPKYRSDEHEWLAGPLTNLGDRTLGRGDTVLLADILRPPPPYDVPAHLGYLEVQLIMPTPYAKWHYMEAGWAAYLMRPKFLDHQGIRRFRQIYKRLRIGQHSNHDVGKHAPPLLIDEPLTTFLLKVSSRDHGQAEAQCHINRLPDTLLVQIFELSLGGNSSPSGKSCPQPLCIAAVCGRWRRIMHDTPRFWTTLWAYWGSLDWKHLQKGETPDNFIGENLHYYNPQSWRYFPGSYGVYDAEMQKISTSRSQKTLTNDIVRWLDRAKGQPLSLHFDLSPNTQRNELEAILRRYAASTRVLHLKGPLDMVHTLQVSVLTSPQVQPPTIPTRSIWQILRNFKSHKAEGYDLNKAERYDLTSLEELKWMLYDDEKSNGIQERIHLAFLETLDLSFSTRKGPSQYKLPTKETDSADFIDQLETPALQNLILAWDHDGPNIRVFGILLRMLQGAESLRTLRLYGVRSDDKTLLQFLATLPGLRVVEIASPPPASVWETERKNYGAIMEGLSQPEGNILPHLKELTIWDIVSGRSWRTNPYDAKELDRLCQDFFRAVALIQKRNIERSPPSSNGQVNAPASPSAPQIGLLGF